MPKYKLIVLSKPMPGRESEYNEWYQNVHLPEVMAVDGFTSARRLRLAENVTETEAMPYAALYNVETDDLKALLGVMTEKMGRGELTMSDAIDTSTATVSFYEDFGPEVTS